MIQKILDDLLSGQFEESFLSLGSPMKIKTLGAWQNYGEEPMLPNHWSTLIDAILNSEQKLELERQGSIRGVYRGRSLSSLSFRLFQSKQSLAAVLRSVPAQADETNLPDVFFETAKRKGALTIVAGTAGSGLTMLMHQMLASFDMKLSSPVAVLSSRWFPLFPEKKLSVTYAQIPFVKEAQKDLALAAEIVFLDFNDLSQLELAIELTGAGKSVVLSTYSYSLQDLLFNLFAYCGEHGRYENFRLMSHLQQIFHHQYLKSAGSPISIYESLLFAPEVREGFLSGDPLLLAKAEKMNGLYMSRNQCLLQNLIRRKIDVKKAFELSNDPEGLDSLLKKVGI